METAISVRDVSKTYQNGFSALNNINLDVKTNEIFALLGPNGAGKTTLISLICGIAQLNQGEILVQGYDVKKEFLKARSLIGLVPQELTTDAFETVWTSVCFSRGIFGLKPNPNLIEKILKDLNLWEKKDQKIMTLSGGMKRRLLIAKSLSHEPKVLFLDEPTAGVDVELRKNMWELVHELRKSGVTIVLTTHYIEEAEEMADRIGVIQKGKLIVVEEKATLLKQMGTKQLILEVEQFSLANSANILKELNLSHKDNFLFYKYDAQHFEIEKVNEIFSKLNREGIVVKDFMTRQSSLEDIFVELVQEKSK